MKRPIKFRVLDTKDGMIIPWDKLCHAVADDPMDIGDGKGPQPVSMLWVMLNLLDRITPQQYTGFKDSKDQEIYEGDFLSAEVRFRKGQDGKVIPVNGEVIFHEGTGQFLLKYNLEGLNTTMALNGLYNINIL